MILAALAIASVKLGELHTYKDWIVGCDNVRTCQANALEPEDGGDDYLMLTISRGALRGDKAALSVPLPEGTAISARFSLKVDGIIVATFTTHAKGSASLPLTGGLLAALGNGERAILFDAKDNKLGEASLAGLAASLRYIDAQQRRVGTVGALKASGTRSDDEAPPPPDYPVIVTPAPSSMPPRTISVAIATGLIGADNASCDYANGKVEPRAYRLDTGHSLVLVDHPCGNGAYNFFTSVYLLDETGPPRPAKFDLPPGMGEPSTDNTGDLTNGDWDPKNRRLSSYEKGRGIGDCGTNETYAWDGKRFRLVEQNAMGECRGSVDYIRTWTARVSR